MTGHHQRCYVNCGLPADECACYRDIMSRDPAVLAALPEVQALIAAAYEVAAKSAEDQERLCAEWFLRTGKHANVYEQLPEVAGRTRASTPAEAIAALAARDAAMIARGMRDAAAMAWALEDGDRWTRAAAQKAILARADQIEKDGK